MTEQHDFRPEERVISIRGNDAYLPVSARMAWLHEATKPGLEHATGYSIDTEPHVITDSAAVFRATVTIYGEGGDIIRRTTGWGTESASGFALYVEKAETKAVGRALAKAGFGTDNLDDDVIADTPRALPQRQAPHQDQQRGSFGGGSGAPAQRQGGSGPTARQVGYYIRLCEERRMDPGDYCEAQLSSPDYERITGQQMSSLIDAVRAMPVEGGR